MVQNKTYQIDVNNALRYTPLYIKHLQIDIVPFQGVLDTSLIDTTDVHIVTGPFRDDFPGFSFWSI